MTVFDLFQKTAKQCRDELAIVDEGRHILYGELLESVDGVREWLEKSLPVRPGSVIAISSHNSWQYIASFLAASSMGLALFPCNKQWRSSELRWFGERLNISGVLAEPEFLATWDEVRDLLPPRSILTIPDEFDRSQPNRDWEPTVASADHPAVFLTTSGSTGVPRLVPRCHRKLVAGATYTSRTLGVGVGHRFLSVVPFHHANGFHNCMLMPLLCGAAVILVRRLVPVSCAELIARERVNIVIASPPIYSFLLETAVHPSFMSSVQQCFITGARPPQELLEKWKTRFGTRLHQWYGMAEANVISIDRAVAEPAPQAGAFVGSIVSGVEVGILDKSGNPLCCGTVGEIAVRSEAVFSGYWQEPSNEFFCGGFFRTGDLGYLDPDRNLYLMGRLRRIINIGGVKVDPVEVEKTIQALPGVSECHVDAISSGTGSELIRARIALREGAALGRREVIEWCRSRLAEYKLPRVIEMLDRLPTTITGKMPAQWRSDERV